MPDQNDGESAVSTEQPLLSHLIELRSRLLRAVLCVLLVFIGLFYFANDIYAWVAKPLMAQMPQGSAMIATEVASPFLTPFKLTLVVSIFASIPYLFYQLWAFVAPGMYRHEKALVYPLLVTSTVLFYLGAAFAYYAVFPLMFAFFTAAAPAGVTVMTDIAHYLDFVLKLFMAFGLAFEVPIATVLLIKTGVASRDSLIEKRPYVLVGSFVIGMLLTPPDIISQVLLAVPIWLLFELGLVMSGFLGRKSGEDAEDNTDKSDS